MQKAAYRHLVAVVTMPVCPKCGKLVSDKKYARYLRRCGTQHKRPARPLDHPENFCTKIQTLG